MGRWLWLVLLLGCGRANVADRHSSDAGRTHADAAAPTAAVSSDAPMPPQCAAHSCDPEEATCSVDAGRAQCSCARGYRDVYGDGSLCEEIDECDRSEAHCAQHASCINTVGAYLCACDPEYHGDGAASCEPNHTFTLGAPDACENWIARGDVATCMCNAGYEGDGVRCADIDECARSLCHGLARCTNKQGSFDCRCPEGYLGDGHGGSGCFERSSRLSEPLIPEITGECPSFTPGTSTAPALLGARLMVGERAAQPTAALLLYWHAAGTTASEVDSMLPAAVRDEILAAGGIIAAFEGSLGTGGTCGATPWFARDDFHLADLLVACAVRDHNIDPHRIYTFGGGTGGFQAGCMAVARSGYLAAVATDSGGLYERQPMQAANGPASITLHPPPQGDTGLIDPITTSARLNHQLLQFGGFAVDCTYDDGTWSYQPPAIMQIAQWKFLQAHPFGISESPYRNGLPMDFPTACKIQH